MAGRSESKYTTKRTFKPGALVVEWLIASALALASFTVFGVAVAAWYQRPALSGLGLRIGALVCGFYLLAFLLYVGFSRLVASAGR